MLKKEVKGIWRNLRSEIMVYIICVYNDIVGTVTKVPAVRDIWAAVVIGMEYTDSVNHSPLAAGTLLTIQPDLHTRKLLNDLYNHRVGRFCTQPVSGRNCRRVAKHRQRVWFSDVVR